jgi:acetolactate synthase I/III small subunit
MSGADKGNAMDNKVVISVIVRDEPRVLTRITSMFARRGFNINSLSVGTTEHLGYSRMTIVVEGDDRTVSQVSRQLEKLEDVIKVTDHSLEKYVDRELILIKIKIDSSENRVEVRQIADDFRARIVDVGRHALTFEVTGDEGKITAFLEQMRPFGILETMRTGRIALTRGSNVDVPSHVYGEEPSKALEVMIQHD